MAYTAEAAQPVTKPEADYRIRFEPTARRIRVVCNGLTVADSTQTIVMHETRYAPIYYFPSADVRMDLLMRTRHQTHCPFKGNASYWTLKVGERIVENVVWSYEDPLAEAALVKGYLAFYGDRVDAVYDGDGERLVATQEAAASLHTNPLVPWLLREAWEASSAKDLVEQLTHRMVAAGIPVWRLMVAIRTLHPLLFSTGYFWRSDGDGVEERQIGHGILQDPRYLESPLVPIFEGAGGVRRRLDVPDPQLDYPVLRDLHAEGGTDYVAMPMTFSDGQINYISLASKQPGGFSTAALGHIYEILPLLSRLFEVHAGRRNAVNLLDTYLGRQSGDKVLNGLIKRGDGEDIHAVIWFCDLRGSTPLADAMSREDFLNLLDQYFECMGGAVLDHGGEVLRFIGDAMLAIFPITDPAHKRPDGCPLTTKACETALAVAQEAGNRIEALNRERRARGEPPLRYGIGLHLGDVMYGNIGTKQRLEFTVVGAAANEAARIESLCKSLKHSILMSADFARHCTRKLASLGHHSLRGVREKQEIFTLPS